MNNKEIIANIAVNTGLFSAEEVSRMDREGIELPIHTYYGWKERGYEVVSADGIETRLWKKKEDGSGFYLGKSYLYTADQVKPIG